MSNASTQRRKLSAFINYGSKSGGKYRSSHFRHHQKGQQVRHGEVQYEVMGDGSILALNKPRSRVKRLRAIRDERLRLGLPVESRSPHQRRRRAFEAELKELGAEGYARKHHVLPMGVPY